MRRHRDSWSAATRPVGAIDRLESRQMLAAPIPIPGNVGVFTDVDGDQVTVRLSGPGALSQFSDAPPLLFHRLLTTGTTDRSRLSVTVKKLGAGDGLVRIGGITADGPLALIAADRVDFSDAITLVGLVKDVRVHNLTGLQLTMGGTGGVTRFSARSIVNSAVVLGDRLARSITLFDASDANITVSAIGTFTVKDDPAVPDDGDFRDDSRLSLGGLAGVARTLGSARVARTLNGVVDVTGPVGSFTVGAMFSTAWSTTADVRTLRSGEVNGCLLSVGSSIGQLVTGDVVGTTISFPTARSLRLRDLIGSTINGTGVDPLGVTIGAFAAARVDDSSISLPAAVFTRGESPPGRMKSFRASLVVSSTIIGGSIGSMAIIGDPSRSLAADFSGSLTLGDTLRAIALDSFSVKGEFSGVVRVLGSAGTIKLGAIGLGDSAGIFVGISPLAQVQNILDNGLPGTAQDLFGDGVGTLRSFIMPKPPASAGFSEANPNIGRFFVIAKVIGSFSVFNGFGQLTDQVGEPWGVGTTSIQRGKISFAGGKRLSATNLTAATLQQAAIDDPALPITSGLGFVQAPFYQTTPPQGDRVFVRLYS